MVILTSSFFLLSLFKLPTSKRLGLYSLGLGSYMMLDIFSSKILFSLSISVYFLSWTASFLAWRAN